MLLFYSSRKSRLWVFFISFCILSFLIIKLKVNLSSQVTKSDVDAALQVLNFAIYHKELTDMEDREQERERERELERKGRDDHPSGENDGSHNRTANREG